MKIALDYDSVLINTPELWTKIFVTKYPDKSVPRPIDLDDWDVAKAFNITKEEMHDIFKETRFGAHFKYGAACDMNWTHWVNRLLDGGHQVAVLTANPKECHKYVQYWLSKHGMGDLEVTYVDSYSDKLLYEWDIIVDDSPHLAEAISGHLDRVMLLYNQPWNQDLELSPNVIRAYNFGDIYDTITQLEKDYD